MQLATTKSRRGRWILAATVLASGAVALFGRAISIALPTIQADFAASHGSMQWVLNAFGVVVAAFMLVSGD